MKTPGRPRPKAAGQKNPPTFFTDSNIFLINSLDKIFEVGLSGDVNKIILGYDHRFGKNREY